MTNRLGYNILAPRFLSKFCQLLWWKIGLKRTDTRWRVVCSYCMDLEGQEVIFHDRTGIQILQEAATELPEKS